MISASYCAKLSLRSLLVTARETSPALGVVGATCNPSAACNMLLMLRLNIVYECMLMLLILMLMIMVVFHDNVEVNIYVNVKFDW